MLARFALDLVRVVADYVVELDFSPVPPVVFDIGSAFSRVGFAEYQAEPTAVFESVVGRPKHKGFQFGMHQGDAYVGDEALAKRGLLTLTVRALFFSVFDSVCSAVSYCLRYDQQRARCREAVSQCVLQHVALRARRATCHRHRAPFEPQGYAPQSYTNHVRDFRRARFLLGKLRANGALRNRPNHGLCRRVWRHGDKDLVLL